MLIHGRLATARHLLRCLLGRLLLLGMLQLLHYEQIVRHGHRRRLLVRGLRLRQRNLLHIDETAVVPSRIASCLLVLALGQNRCRLYVVLRRVGRCHSRHRTIVPLMARYPAVRHLDKRGKERCRRMAVRRHNRTRRACRLVRTRIPVQVWLLLLILLLLVHQRRLLALHLLHFDLLLLLLLLLLGRRRCSRPEPTHHGRSRLQRSSSTLHLPAGGAAGQIFPQFRGKLAVDVTSHQLLLKHNWPRGPLA